MLREALVKFKEKGLGEVTLGCYKDNFASSKTIINNGGVLYNETMMMIRWLNIIRLNCNGGIYEWFNNKTRYR